MNDEFREVVAAVTYNPLEDKFLLLKRSSDQKRFHNEWEFPAGFIEDEKEQQAALRELKEETGLLGEVVKTGESFEIDTELYSFRINPVLVKAGSEKVELTREHEEYRWIEIGRIENFNTVPQLSKNLERVGILDNT